MRFTDLKFSVGKLREARKLVEDPAGLAALDAKIAELEDEVPDDASMRLTVGEFEALNVLSNLRARIGFGQMLSEYGDCDGDTLARFIDRTEKTLIEMVKELQILRSRMERVRGKPE